MFKGINRFISGVTVFLFEYLCDTSKQPRMHPTARCGYVLLKKYEKGNYAKARQSAFEMTVVLLILLMGLYKRISGLKGVRGGEGLWRGSLPFYHPRFIFLSFGPREFNVKREK